MTLLAALILFQIEISPMINPNTATKAELMATDKAVTSEIADKIINGRPYNSHHEVRKVVGDELMEKIFKFQIQAPTTDRPPVPSLTAPPRGERKEKAPKEPPLPLPGDLA